MLNYSGRGRNLHLKLIEKCRNNDKAAQFEIYKLYYKSMFNTCLRFIKDKAEAEDIMQDAFLAAFQKINSYKGDLSFGAWLKKIVINRSIDVLRTKKVIFEEINDNLEITDNEDFEEDKEASAELVEKIKRAIDLLPEGYKVVITLYLIEGYDHEEIAQILNINESSSRSQLVRAKKKVYELLKKNEL